MAGLGDLGVLPDAIVSVLTFYLDVRSICRLACCSKFWRLFAYESPLWMDRTLAGHDGPITYKANWRQTALSLIHRAAEAEAAAHQSTLKRLQEAAATQLETDTDNTTHKLLTARDQAQMQDTTTTAVHLQRQVQQLAYAVAAAACPAAPLDGFTSDFLYRRWYRSNVSLVTFCPPVDQVPRVQHSSLNPAEFLTRYDMPAQPVILTGFMDAEWPSGWQDHWRLDNLTTSYGATLFKASRPSGGKTTVRFSDYVDYMTRQADEDPLYIFDEEFGEAAPAMLDWYTTPSVVNPDFTQLLEPSMRPPSRWLVLGPARAGASWHVDPALTSAWNALTSGLKRWALYPPHMPPPGPQQLQQISTYAAAAVCSSASSSSSSSWCTVSDAGSEGSKWCSSSSSSGSSSSSHHGAGADSAGGGLTSLQWYLEVYPQLPPHMRPYELVQHPGEIVFIPGGWWHCVLNLQPSVAVTQNFVSAANLERVVAQLAVGSRAYHRDPLGFYQPQRRPWLTAWEEHRRQQWQQQQCVVEQCHHHQQQQCMVEQCHQQQQQQCMVEQCHQQQQQQCMIEQCHQQQQQCMMEQCHQQQQQCMVEQCHQQQQQCMVEQGHQQQCLVEQQQQQQDEQGWDLDCTVGTAQGAAVHKGGGAQGTATAATLAARTTPAAAEEDVAFAATVATPTAAAAATPAAVDNQHERRLPITWRTRPSPFRCSSSSSSSSAGFCDSSSGGGSDNSAGLCGGSSSSSSTTPNCHTCASTSRSILAADIYCHGWKHRPAPPAAPDGQEAFAWAGLLSAVAGGRGYLGSKLVGPLLKALWEQQQQQQQQRGKHLQQQQQQGSHMEQQKQEQKQQQLLAAIANEWLAQKEWQQLLGCICEVHGVCAARELDCELAFPEGGADSLVFSVQNVVVKFLVGQQELAGELAVAVEARTLLHLQQQWPQQQQQQQQGLQLCSATHCSACGTACSTTLTAVSSGRNHTEPHQPPRPALSCPQLLGHGLLHICEGLTRITTTSVAAAAAGANVAAAVPASVGLTASAESSHATITQHSSSGCSNSNSSSSSGGGGMKSWHVPYLVLGRVDGQGTASDLKCALTELQKEQLSWSCGQLLAAIHQSPACQAGSSSSSGGGSSSSTGGGSSSSSGIVETYGSSSSVTEQQLLRGTFWRDRDGTIWSSRLGCLDAEQQQQQQQQQQCKLVGNTVSSFSRLEHSAAAAAAAAAQLTLLQLQQQQQQKLEMQERCAAVGAGDTAAAAEDDTPAAAAGGGVWWPFVQFLHHRRSDVLQQLENQQSGLLNFGVAASDVFVNFPAGADALALAQQQQQKHKHQKGSCNKTAYNYKANAASSNISNSPAACCTPSDAQAAAGQQQQRGSSTWQTSSAAASSSTNNQNHAADDCTAGGTLNACCSTTCAAAATAGSTAGSTECSTDGSTMSECFPCIGVGDDCLPAWLVRQLPDYIPKDLGVLVGAPAAAAAAAAAAAVAARAGLMHGACAEKRSRGKLPCLLHGDLMAGNILLQLPTAPQASTHQQQRQGELQQQQQRQQRQGELQQRQQQQQCNDVFEASSGSGLQSVSFIDFADGGFGDPLYDFVAVFVSVLECDVKLLEVALDGYSSNIDVAAIWPARYGGLVTAAGTPAAENCGNTGRRVRTSAAAAAAAGVTAAYEYADCHDESARKCDLGCSVSKAFMCYMLLHEEGVIGQLFEEHVQLRCAGSLQQLQQQLFGWMDVWWSKQLTST